jgi:hypothetical protein
MYKYAVQFAALNFAVLYVQQQQTTSRLPMVSSHRNRALRSVPDTYTAYLSSDSMPMRFWTLLGVRSRFFCRPTFICLAAIP